MIELQKQKQWVLWKEVIRDGGKSTKIPCSKAGRATSISNDECIKSYEQARDEWLKDMTQMISGIGFVIKDEDDFIGIDIDSINKWYGWREIIRKFSNTYIEWSPSGTGLHVWCRGYLPSDENVSCKRIGSHETGAIEIYGGKRFLTMTFNPLEGYEDNDIEPNQESINWLFHSMNDQQLISKILSSTNATKVQKLFEGKWQDAGYASHSEADLGLVRILSNCGAPIHQIDRIYRKSKLYRSKWMELRGSRTYGQLTLKKGTTESKVNF